MVKKGTGIKVISMCMAMLMMVLCVLSSYEHVEAATASQNNIVARADYLYDMTWVCQKTVAGWRGQYYYYAGNTYRIPYGQPVHAGRYIGYYVSVDDFMASTKNASSIFYRSRSNCSGMDSVYYATDCSAFVSWCWGISRQTTATIPYYSTYMGMANLTNVYNLKLGDCLNSNYIGHVVLVTDLKYNSNGVLTQIEITEQTPPQLKRSYYTPSQLANKYGGYYGIYRYYGNVPAAPGGYTNTTTTTNNITTMYYPKCGSSYTSLYPAMDSIGVSCDWSLHCRIAAKNGIEDFTGTVEQNTQLLDLLKQGKLLNPDYVEADKKEESSTTDNNSYYAKCASSYTTFYAAMDSIGVSCDWELHCKIADVNGIEDFVGTAAQNTQLLNLLKKGKLIKPESGEKTKIEQFYAKCGASFTSLYPALNSIGISCDWDLHCKIAEVNGITGFTGTVAQNTQLLNLLKQGLLINPNGTTGNNTCYQSCASSYETFYAAMESIGISCDWQLHCQIASINGIADFEGTVDQNTQLLNLLKAGRLVKPEGTAAEKPNYFEACASNFTSLYPALESIGISCDWELHCKIAEINGIEGFTGTVAQNTQLLNLLKEGKLINPGAEKESSKIQYFIACDSSYETFYAALDSIGVVCDWDFHCEIAEANGVVDFTGTAAQNTYLLSLLKEGKLIDPSKSTITNTGGSTGGTTNTTGKRYAGYKGGMAGDGVVYAHGLDLSSWQGSNLNFQNIKNAGYSYVILRAGTTYGKDSCFETYYKRAKAAGLNVGAYYYSYATTVAGAQKDANNMISWISGKKFEYPIYFDYEDPSQDYLSKTTSKNICLKFMDMLANKGYLVGLYTGYYKSTQLLLSEICEKYEFWVAYYYDNTHTSLGSSFCKRYGMYQYTCTKYVNGAGPFDANVAYKNYPAIVKKYGFNGY